jgi:hypothetical protein
MKHSWADSIKTALSASRVEKGEILQPLWSGYGEIFRARLHDASVESVIVKFVNPQNHNGSHPRGWHSAESVQRKLRSYEIEQSWYEHYAQRCSVHCRVAECYTSHSDGSLQWIVLEDLDLAGYPLRFSELSPDACRPCLNWLAHFHARFMHQQPTRLWTTGTYWHLATRHQEWQACTDATLKKHASILDSLLNQCTHQTLVHGDAKVANFCFANDGDSVAAVDFQYTGGGCGIRDVAYFMGSCLSAQDCLTHADTLLDYYFATLKSACEDRAEPIANVEFQAIEKEWRVLYPVAWADFHRFLAGWAPDHHKINRYAQQQTDAALQYVSSR